MKVHDEATDSYAISSPGDLSHPPNPGPRPRRSILGLSRGIAALLIVVIVLAGGGVGAFVAKQHADQLQGHVVSDLQQGANDLQAAKALAVKANSSGGDAGQLDQAVAKFQGARKHFQRALDQVDSDLVLRGGQFAPGYGDSYIAPRVRTVEAISHMGIDLSNAGEMSTELVAAILKPNPTAVKSGARLLAAMQLAEAKVPAIKSALQKAQDETTRVDPGLLPADQRASFTKAKSDIGRGLTDLNELAQLTPAIVEFLGGNSPRTYLVEQPDPAELRAGGGFLGSYSILTAKQGDITLTKSGDSFYIDYPYARVGSPKYIKPPGPLEEFTGTQGYIFGDSNFLPDFRDAAKTGEMLYEHETGTKVDGVISIDPFAVADLLGVTGPIEVPEWHTTVNASNFAEDVFQQQEIATHNVFGRKQFFAEVAKKLLEKVGTLPSSKWPQLMTTLNAMVTQRHFQVYANNPVAQAALERIGWSGAMLKPASADETMMEVETNLGGDKANHWLTRSYDYVLTERNGVLHHELTISYVNTTPRGYLGGQTYSCYVRMYYPALGTGGQAHLPNPPRIPNTEKHDGFKMLDGWFTIHVLKGGRGVARIGFLWDTKWDGSSTRTIYWQKQTGSTADPIKITYVANGRTFTTSTNLAQDRVLVLSGTGIAVQAGAAGQAKLPLIGSPS